MTDTTLPGTATTLEQLIDLARDVQEAYLARKLTLATAESCTGGLVGYVLTEISGSSDYYVGGVISYSDEVKRSELGVPKETLAKHGAVSAQTAVAMATGARERLRADAGVSVTGIAGPSGGTPDKAVGLTYVGIADAEGHDVRRFVWSGDRASNKRESARAALELVLERVSRA